MRTLILLLGWWGDVILGCHAYSFQTFAVGEVLTAAKMDQVEVNIRDHQHGVSSVSAAGQIFDDSFAISGSADATKKVRIEVDTLLTTGATRVWTAPDANITVVGTDTAQQLDNKTLVTPVINTSVSGTALAAQAAMEAGTSTALLVTPGGQVFHPLMLKAWGEANAAGSLAAGANMDAPTDTGTGIITWNLTTDMSGVNYSAVPGMRTTSFNGAARISSQAAGTVEVTVTNYAGTATDPDAHSIVCAGDRA